MKADFGKASRTLVAMGVLAALLPWQASAAKINATLSHESGDYGSDYNYAGPRLDMTINPDGSNWYYSMGWRDRSHDSDQTYNRTDFTAAYRFRFDGGWIQPNVQIRKDTSTYANGSKLVTDFYKSETVYMYSFNDRWGIWGEATIGLDKQTNKSVSVVDGKVAVSEMKNDYLSWEVEPGVRYYFTDGSRVTLSYYNVGQRSTKGGEKDWGFADHKSSQQARLYYYVNTPIGLTISPYIRLPLGYGDTHAWYDSAAWAETKTQSKTSRYALQLAYPLTDSIQLQGEYYFEETKYKEGYTMGKPDGEVHYLKLGVRAAF